MKRTFKRVLASLLTVVMLLTAAPLSGFVGMELNLDWLSFDWLDFNTKASAASYSGTCGENLIWSLDTSTGKLIISGTGEMMNCSGSSNVPWYSYRSSIKNVTVGDGVTSIGSYAFYYCTNLASITIPDGVTSIGHSAFNGCERLTSITIPDSVTTIGEYAFAWCSLRSVTIGNSVTTIGYSAFYYCDSLTSVIIPDSVTTIGEGAFGYCDSLTSVKIGNSVTAIGEKAFYYCDSLTSVIIPDSVTTIGEDAFGHCDSLTSVKIGNSVTAIGEEAFRGCTRLTSIEVDTDNEYYSSDSSKVLYNKDKTELVQYPIGNKRTEFIIPDSVTTIVNYAFEDCESLTTITIGNSVTSIGSYAFYDCTNLTSITIPDSVTSIGEDAFNDCESLTSITIPDSVISIGEDAFYNTGYYNDSSNWEDDVLYIGNHLIKANTSISGAYTIKEGTKCIAGGAFKSCDSLTSVTIANSVTTIGNGAFSSCDSLTSVTVGNSVTTIGHSAFYNCNNLTSVTIPDSVTTIGYRAFFTFAINISLTDVYYTGTQEQWNKIIINSDNSSLLRATIHFNSSGSTDPDTPDEPDNFTESIKFGADRFSFGQDMTGVAGDTFDALLVYASKENDINDLTITSSDPAVATVGAPKIDKGDYITEENEMRALVPITLKSAGTATIMVKSPKGVSESITIAVEDKEKSIAVLSTEKSFTVKTGESMWLAFGMMVDGKLIGEWEKMSVTVSDPTLVLLSEYKKTEYGYSLEVIGKKEGVTNFTITDTETGISTSIVVSVLDDYSKSYSYAISDIETFYPNNKWEDHIATNIYDLNGIYINNYSCSKRGSTYNVSFNAYNQRYHFGAIDIYDADGNWIGSEAIEKYSDISSLYDTGEQIVYMVLDATTGSWLTYEQAMLSKKTTINIEVPVGGYFTISNNFAESPGSFIYNVSDILINGLTAFFDVSSSIGNLKSLKPADLGKEIMKELFADPDVTEAWMDVFKDVVHYRITEAVRDFSTSDIDVVCSEITNIFESSLQRVKVDWKDAVKNCAGLAESAFQKFAGPAGIALEGCFAFANVINTIMQVRNLAASVDEAYVTIYSSIDEGYINPYGVIVNTNGNMDSEAVLQVFRISDNDAIEIILDNKNPLEKHALYNICFVKDDQQVQPNGKVKVYVPIPEGLVGNTCKVYRQETDGSWTILDAAVEGNYLTFETDHFSLYAVVGNRAELKITSLPYKLTYLPNSTIDTAGMVLELNGEKITDGYLCEPSITGNVGTQVITVRYGATTVDFSVQVVNEMPSPEPEVKGKVNSVDINNISMNYKDSTTLTPSINADSGVKYDATYSSSDTDVVSVDSNGRLTTNGTGSATITVTVTDEHGNTVSDTCDVEVKYTWWQWIIVIVLFGWIWY